MITLTLWVLGIGAASLILTIIDQNLNLKNLEVKPSAKKNIYKDYVIREDGIIDMVKKVDIKG